MGTITTTKKDFDDNLDFATIKFYIGPPNEDNNTLAKRLRVETEFEIDRDDGKLERGSKNTRVNDHAGLTDPERTTLRSLLLKIYNTDAAV